MTIDTFKKHAYDAAVHTIAVCIYAYSAARFTVKCGKDARVWYESEDGKIARLMVEIVYLSVLLVWQYFISGKAQAHWNFINDIVDDGLGLYGSSPMGDVLGAYIRKQARCVYVASKHTLLYVLNRLGYAVARRYGRVQAKVFCVA